MKYLLILSTVVSFGQFNPIFYNSAKPRLNPSNTNISGYYKFDNDAVDAAGLNATGTVTGVTYVSGKTGNAASFTNTTDIIDVADSDNFSFTTGTDTPYSVSMWVYFTGFSSGLNRLLSKRDAGSIAEWHVTASATNVGLVQFSGGTTSVGTKAFTLNTTLNLNTWYHLVFTSGTDFSIYINGVKHLVTPSIGGSYVSMTNTSSNLYIGNNLGIVNGNHQGYIEDVGIWKNRVLTLAEVNYLYSPPKTYPF